MITPPVKLVADLREIECKEVFDPFWVLGTGSRDQRQILAPRRCDCKESPKSPKAPPQPAPSVKRGFPPQKRQHPTAPSPASLTVCLCHSTTRRPTARCSCDASGCSSCWIRRNT